MSTLRFMKSGDNRLASSTLCAKGRPKHIVSHLEPPGFQNPLEAPRRTYTQIAASAKGHLKGWWVLHDVHIVDHALVEVMALLKMSWQQQQRGPKAQLHILFVAPCPKAALAWVQYIAGKDAEKGLHISLPIPSFPPPSRRVIEYVPDAHCVFVCSWIYHHELKGDVLIFTASAAHREELVRELNSGAYSRYPVVEITNTNVVPFSRKGPRIVVGTSTLDFLVSFSTELTERVQHVIDFGTVFYQRQDTGYDWEEGYVTHAMALRRLHLTGAKASGTCLRLYKEASLLSDSCLALHSLNQDLCRAKLMVKCGPLAFENLPLILQPCSLSFSVANIMSLLQVEKPVARIIHKGSFDVGIAVAAIMARHPGSCPQVNYECCRQGKMSPNVMLHIQKWSMHLGRSRHHVFKCLRKSTWEDVLPLIYHGYADTVAMYTNVRDLYIDVASGDILRRSSHCRECPPQVVVYTHRHEQHIVSSIPIPSAHDVAKDTIRSYQLTSPLRFKNHLQIQAMQAFFESRHVVAVSTSETTIRLLYGKRVTDIHGLVKEWTSAMKQKARDTPILAPLGHDMYMTLTAGLQFADAVTGNDFIVIGCDADNLTSLELVFLDTIPGNWYVNKSAMLLPKRKTADDMWDNVDNIFIRPLKREYVEKCQAPQLSVKLVVRTYAGKSTGRAVVRSLDKEWTTRVQDSWKWVLDHEDQDLKTPYGFLTTVANIPEHLDEMDIAALLQLEVKDVMLERTGHVVTHLPFLTDFFHEANPDAMVKTTRTSRHYDFSMEISQDRLQHTLECVYQKLPTRNPMINQPLRVFWLISTSTGSHPPSQCLQKRVPTRIDCNGCVKNELDLLRSYIICAQDEMECITPSFLWLPSLVAPWITVDIPYVETSAKEGPLFRVYGTKRERNQAQKQLQALALHPPSPTSKEHTYATCPICFEPHAFFQLKLCECRFCFLCLATTFEKKCLDADFVGDMDCPLCRERVCTEDLAQLISKEGLNTHARKLAAFLSVRIPQIIRECPAQCGTFGRALAQDQVFACLECHQEWCIKCSTNFGSAVKAHKGYCDKRWDSPFWKEFACQAIEAGAKACPVCGTFVVKDGGCNHVTCQGPSCHTHFCWKCLQAYGHHQSSLQAQGVILDVQEHVVVISVLPETWDLPCKTPCPTIVHYKPDFAKALLLENETLKKNSKVWVYSYIYDHIDACAFRT